MPARCSLLSRLGVRPGHWAHREPAPHGDPVVQSRFPKFQQWDFNTRTNAVVAETTSLLPAVPTSPRLLQIEQEERLRPAWPGSRVYGLHQERSLLTYFGPGTLSPQRLCPT
jgi:hypothetical protein